MDNFTSKNSNPNAGVGNVKQSEWMRCPICGHITTFKGLSGHYRFEALTCSYPGKRQIVWSLRQWGYDNLRVAIIRKLEDLIDLLKDNGCDFYPVCQDCPRSKVDCPNEELWTAKTIKNADRNAEIVRLKATGKTTSELAQQYKLSVKQIQRILYPKER